MRSQGRKSLVADCRLPRAFPKRLIRPMPLLASAPLRKGRSDIDTSQAPCRSTGCSLHCRGGSFASRLITPLSPAHQSKLSLDPQLPPRPRDHATRPNSPQQELSHRDRVALQAKCRHQPSSEFHCFQGRVASLLLSISGGYASPGHSRLCLPPPQPPAPPLPDRVKATAIMAAARPQHQTLCPI